MVVPWIVMDKMFFVVIMMYNVMRYMNIMDRLVDNMRYVMRYMDIVNCFMDNVWCMVMVIRELKIVC